MYKSIEKDILNINEARDLYTKLTKRRISPRMFAYYVTGYRNVSPRIKGVKKSSGWVIARDEIIRFIKKGVD